MQKNREHSAVRKEFIFERKDFMKFKVVGKSLILTDYSHKITEGENSFDTVEIAIPRYHDECDLSTLSFRFSEISENGENAAVQVLSHEKCDEKYIYLKGTITADFSAITGKVTFMLTGVNGENVVAKFQSNPFTVSDDISLASLPNETTAEQLFNQAQLEVQKAIDAANRAEKASQTPAPAEIYPATDTQLGGIKSGNDISVDGNGSVTVNSVNGKTLGKSVPENAVFTDTVYTLPKATTETLGGVKVDGTTITANSDGTISASDSETLKKEIEDIKSIIMPASQPNNYLIYDNSGNPSVMVAIPKFYLDEVIDGASHTVHPAFIVNGVEQNVIYISKYQNIVENDKAYSLPMKAPVVNVNFDQAWDYCKNKGKGWHLMTNAEWAAIALWCKKNSTMPKGNNNYGKDIYEVNIPPKAISTNTNGGNVVTHTLTGSGRESWYHDETFAGISDLNGNVWEWVCGARLVDGEIQIIANNDAADQNNSILPESSAWKAVMPDGSLVTPGTAGTLKWDYTAAVSSETDQIHLTTQLVNQQISSQIYGNKAFKELTSKDGVNVPEILKALALFPADTTGYNEEKVWIKNRGEQIAVRGGHWSRMNDCGIFAMHISDSRSYIYSGLGFRSAYCNIL